MRIQYFTSNVILMSPVRVPNGAYKTSNDNKQLCREVQDADKICNFSKENGVSCPRVQHQIIGKGSQILPSQILNFRVKGKTKTAYKGKT